MAKRPRRTRSRGGEDVTPSGSQKRLCVLERVKCRTAGRSRPSGGGVRSAPPRGGGPGEERHLTRVRTQYAAGCWWGWFLTPTGCPRGERKDFLSLSENPLFNLIQGTKVPQPVTARLSANIRGPKIDCSVPMAMGLTPANSGWWFRMKMDIYRRAAGVQKGGRRVTTR